MLSIVLKKPKDFAQLCVQIAPRLKTIAMGVSGSKSEAEDIVQQAFTIAFEKEDRFRSENQFRLWLTRIVRNCAINHRRKFARRKTFATDPAELNPQADRFSHDVVNKETGELNPDQASFDDRVQAALQTMSKKARCCLLLRTVQELSYKEIAELMEIPEGTAMNLVHRSKRQLRDLLTNQDESCSPVLVGEME